MERWKKKENEKKEGQGGEKGKVERNGEKRRKKEGLMGEKEGGKGRRKGGWMEEKEGRKEGIKGGWMEGT